MHAVSARLTTAELRELWLRIERGAVEELSGWAAERVAPPSLQRRPPARHGERPRGSLERRQGQRG